MATNRAPAVRVDYLIRWYDHHHFQGYVFSTMRKGRKYVKHFSAKPDGARKALARARAYRDALLAKLDPPTRLKSWNSRNVTGIVGVSLTQERTRNGGVLRRYAAYWPVKGRRRPAKKSFSIAKYGKREARRLAIQARNKGVAAFKASVSYRDYEALARSRRNARRS